MPALPRWHRYEVRVPKEESDLVGDLRYSWRKLKKLAADVGDSLATLQVSGRVVERVGKRVCRRAGGQGQRQEWAVVPAAWLVLELG
jgi:hypothetical protein